VAKHPTPFTVVLQLNKGNHPSGRASKTYLGYFEERDLLIQSWIQSLPQKDYNSLEVMAKELVASLHKRRSKAKTLISINSAMGLLVLISLQNLWEN
jgi:hypothetical protein